MNLEDFKLRLYFYKYFPDFVEVSRQDILDTLRIFEGNCLQELLQDAVHFYEADQIRSYPPRTDLGAFINMPPVLGSERYHLSKDGYDIAVGSTTPWRS